MGVIHENDVKEKNPASSTGCEFDAKRNGMRVFKLCWYLCFLGGGSGSL